jgi:acetylornithine deacetylase
VDDLRQAVQSRQADLEALASALVRCPSLPGEEGPVQSLLAKRLGDMGLETRVQPVHFERLRSHPAFGDDGFTPDGRVNVVARWPGSGGGRSLILNGHVDVVSTGDLSLWREPPWSGTIRDGILHGRGSCDMKSGLAAGIIAVQVLRDLEWQPAGDLTIESVVGEESGGCGTLMTIVDGITADAAVILEPTALTLCPVQSGALTFRLIVRGRAAHGAMRQHGVSAIEKFQLLHQAIISLERDRHFQFRSLLYDDPDFVAPISVGTVQGGEWHSTVAETVVAEGRFGVFPGEGVDSARAALETVLVETAAADPWMVDHPPRLEWFEGQFEAGETSVNHPLVDSLAAAHRRTLGIDPPIRGVSYGSDLRLFTNHAGIPAVLYGPGDVAVAHAANESIPLKEVMEAVRVLAGFIAEWCGAAG